MHLFFNAVKSLKNQTGWEVLQPQELTMCTSNISIEILPQLCNQQPLSSLFRPVFSLAQTLHSNRIPHCFLVGYKSASLVASWEPWGLSSWLYCSVGGKDLSAFSSQISHQLSSLGFAWWWSTEPKVSQWQQTVRIISLLKVPMFWSEGHR